jgi:putative aminopeptidase FrvX
MEFLKQLTETPGVSGREERVRDLIREHTEGWWDNLEEDRIGNLIGTIKAAKRKRGVQEKGVVIGCHLDQIGFYVRSIDEEGFLRVQQLGGFDTRNLFARRVRVLTPKGELPGVLNPITPPIHVATPEDLKKIPRMTEFSVDLGMPLREVKRRINPGDPVVLEQTTVEMGQLVCGQAMDNRISPWVALNAIKKVKGKNIYDIYWVGSAQEEVGLRGAMVAAQNIEAEVAIAVDVTLAVDTPTIRKEDTISKLGDGVAIKVMDSASISTRSLLDEFVALAKRRKIKFQYELLPLGGTDAGMLQRFGGGRRAITLSIPCRYVHTVCESVHKKDLTAAVDLLAAWLMGS